MTFNELFHFSYLSTHGVVPLRLSTHGEANEVGTDTEASTLTSRNANARADNIKDSEDRSGDYTEGDDVLEGEGLGGHKDSGDGYKETLNQILDKAVYDFSGGVHSFYI